MKQAVELFTVTGLTVHQTTDSRLGSVWEITLKCCFAGLDNESIIIIVVC